MTSASFSRFSWRRMSGGTSTWSNLTASFANCLIASMPIWFSRALSASVSSVMYVSATQPACPWIVPSFSIVAFTRSMNVLASSAVGAAVPE